MQYESKGLKEFKRFQNCSQKSLMFFLLFVQLTVHATLITVTDIEHACVVATRAKQRKSDFLQRQLKET